MGVITLKHISNSLKLAGKDFSNFPSNSFKVFFSDLDFSLVFSLIECIQSCLQLHGLHKSIEKIIHFVFIVENHFLVIIDIIVELFELFHIAGLKFTHFLYYLLFFLISFLVVHDDKSAVDCFDFFPRYSSWL